MRCAKYILLSACENVSELLIVIGGSDCGVVSWRLQRVSGRGLTVATIHSQTLLVKHIGAAAQHSHIRDIANFHPERVGVFVLSPSHLPCVSHFTEIRK